MSREEEFHWSWQLHPRGEWDAASDRPEGLEIPRVGDQLTVHREDGATDTVTVWDAHAVRDLATGQGRVHCKVCTPREK